MDQYQSKCKQELIDLDDEYIIEGYKSQEQQTERYKNNDQLYSCANV